MMFSTLIPNTSAFKEMEASLFEMGVLCFCTCLRHYEAERLQLIISIIYKVPDMRIH